MITVLTPTYNRGYCLEQLYRSLLRQTVRNFEWIIVDDGSDDATGELVLSWINKREVSSIEIYYYKKLRGGKHTALNLGVSKSKGEYIFIVDSDDYLVSDAIEKVQAWIQEIDSNKCFAGVAGLKGFTENKTIGERPKNRFVDCTNVERKRFSLRGDKAEVYRKEILEKYPFPVFEGEYYIPEDVVWNAIAGDGYMLRWHNEIIYIATYLEDGLTRRGMKEDRRVQYFQGYTYREKINVKVQSGIEKYMELGRYIDLVKKWGNAGKSEMKWTIRTLSITKREYFLGELFYLLRKYGKKIRKMILWGQKQQV